jgi:hypothetical protein
MHTLLFQFKKENESKQNYEKMESIKPQEKKRQVIRE